MHHKDEPKVSAAEKKYLDLKAKVEAIGTGDDYAKLRAEKVEAFKAWEAEQIEARRAAKAAPTTPPTPAPKANAGHSK